MRLSKATMMVAILGLCPVQLATAAELGVTDEPIKLAVNEWTVSATALPYAARLDVWLKRQGMRSSMRDFGCPSRMA